ncbi:alanine racemase domain protein [Alkaliphilus metalliredigens QYMF]|uniref:Alanine racemase domain protein n=1 Tax=Alkaliphilus metalliredigens (strain QYMF) TaxID=293826 RepID=A6TNW6_ALKMQ|nr:alanine racemase [Alkaliphilus metalliredigens]ABR47884.1 alanine racemase domain protein [Alkaliphilus metalliredigens QYMF]
MNIKDLDTPCLVVDLDQLEKNIEEMGVLAKDHGVALWPMVKTHKSEYIVKKQLENGAEGVLAAKLGEAEKMVEAGAKKVMMAYPIIGEGKLKRLVALTEKAEVFCSIDSLEVAEILNEKAITEGIVFQCIILIDSGLKRLGIAPHEVKKFYNSLARLQGIKIVGVGTHGGHVYGAMNTESVMKAGEEEKQSVLKASEILEGLGVTCHIIALGSTPTVMVMESYKGIKQIRPGNYVFYDAIQVALGVVPLENCALRLLTTVLSVPEAGRAIIDGGSKMLGLDAGAHGNTNIRGYGIVKEKPWIVVQGLSEELGKLSYHPDEVNLKVGERLEIIPNHACSVANLVEKIYGVRNNEVVEEIIVTARGLSQ